MNDPLVTVSCLSYNQEDYISQCLDGILMQKTNFEIEILIHDDASTDNTADIIRTYLKKDKRISAILQKENQFSKGIKPSPTYLWPKARGKYIALCEGDDYWTDPLKLQKQVDFLENNIKYILSFHDIFNVNEFGIKTNKSCLNKNQKKDLSSSELIGGSYVSTQSVCFRSYPIKVLPEVFKEVYNGDTFLYSFLGQYGKGKYQAEIAPSAYRIHSKGIWTKIETINKVKNNLFTFKVLLQVTPICKRFFIFRAISKFQYALLMEYLIHNRNFRDICSSYIGFAYYSLISLNMIFFIKKHIFIVNKVIR